ncbi:hypothetical protein D9619_002904 [Psilocybe cf. subviscida]|uniref:Uncharacterized protein n=1 Tax=Psilocybe cf. subviscida TaxID=2480587 RepID=A0A8H5EU14_9AGAR|nr:hypothetical protein D9619_002904 [Psilocybe cf. subviscida]
MILRLPSRPSGSARIHHQHPVAPSHLLSDPAFSPDPHSNPYFASNREPAWAISPPAGHPVFKNKQHRPPTVEVTTYGTGLSEPPNNLDFQLIQPPNSPVSFLDGGSGTEDPPSFPFTIPKPLHSSLNPAKSTSSPSTKVIAPLSVTTHVEAPSAPAIPQLPPPKAIKKRRMPFLSRRKTTQPTETYAAENTKASMPPPSALTDDVTREGRPAKALRMGSEPIMPQYGERSARQARSITTSTSTPSSIAPTTSSMGSKLLSGRTSELDKIDELDETSPWGVALHHGGPYEAALRVIKPEKGRTPLGISNGGAGTYHNQAMKAHGHAYVPPQAPIGISLNLKPGQILPRTFHEKRSNQPPRMREGATLPPRFQAAALSQSNTSPTPSLYRSQSYAASSSQSSAVMSHTVGGFDLAHGARPDLKQGRRQSQPLVPSVPSHHALDAVLPRDGYRQVPQNDFSTNAGSSQREGNSDHSHSQHAFNTPSDPAFHSPAATMTGLSQQNLSSAHLPRTLLQVQPAVQFLSPPQQVSQSVPNQTDSRVPTGFVMQPASDDHSADHALVEDDEEDSDEEDYSVDAPHDIGLAMLQSESETLIIPSPQIYLPHGTSEEDLEFNPYDPVHMEKDYSRSPSPLVVLYARSDRSHDSYSSYAPSRAPSLALSHGSSSHESHRSHRHESMTVIPPPLPHSAPPSQDSHMSLRPDSGLLPQVPNLAPGRRTSEGPPAGQALSRQTTKSMLAGRSASELRVRNPEASSQDFVNVDVGYQKKASLFGGTTGGGHHEDPPPYKAVAVAPTTYTNDLHSLSQHQHRDDIRSNSSSINNNHSSYWQMNEIPPSDDSHEPPPSNTLNITKSTENIYIHSVNRPGLQPPPAIALESDSALSTPGTQSQGVPRDRSPPMLPARRSRERIQIPTPGVSALDLDHERPRPSAPIAPPIAPDRDVRSLYPSSVSITSSYLRNGPPPPHRRVPKHLVMPAPLNTNQNSLLERNHIQQQTWVRFGFFEAPLPPPSTVLANHQASLQAPSQPRTAKEYPTRAAAPPAFATTPVKTAVFVPVAPKAQDVAVPSSRKLKKRTSVLPPPAHPTATIVSTTVSFAPPVVGFANSPEVEKNISRMKNEKVPKRVLSKKRTDI